MKKNTEVIEEEKMDETKAKKGSEKRLLREITALVVLLMIGICTQVSAVPLAEGSITNLTILHTNDGHAHLDDIARLATAVQEVRDDVGEDNAFLLDAGDVFSGTLYFSLYRGMADLEFMNMLGYDSMCLGNHEFDNFATRPDDLTNFVDSATFPILCANFNFSDEQKLAGKIGPWVIIEKGGEQYGIFGLTTGDTAVISSPGDNITINDHTATAEEVVAALEDQGINKIIALTHLGWNEDIALAHEVKGIDIIVGGHSDTVPDPYPTVINGNEPVIVVQAGGHGEYLGRFDVAFDADGVIQTYGGELLEVEIFDKDPEYAAKLAEYQEAIEVLMETVVGETLVDLDGKRAHVRTRETNLGNLITDAMLAKASCVDATIAIQNGGGIRASIPAGNITLGKLMEVQPFGNYLVVFNLSGEQISAALENGVSKIEEVSGRFPQIAGLRYTWDPSKKLEERIISVEVKTTEGYQPIDPLASYRIVTNNFLYSGGDGYTMFQNGTDLVLLGFVDYEVLREYIEEHSPVALEVEGRILEGRHHFIDLAEEWQEMGLDLNDLEPEFVATTPDGLGALVTIQEGGAVAVVNSSKLIKIIKLHSEAEPDAIAISPDGKIAVTANEEGQSISLLDLSQGLARAELANTMDVLQFLPMDDPDFKHDEGEVDPEGVAIFNKEGRSYAVLALEKSASLLVLDVTDPDDVTLVSLLPVGISGDEQNPDDRVAEPEGVAISPQGDMIAVGNEEEGTVSLIPIVNGAVPSFGERVNFDPSGKEAEIIAFTPDQKNLLVTNSKENTLIILNISDLTEIKEKRVLDLSSYGEPTSVAVSPNGEYALVSIADGVNPTVNPGKVVAISLLPQGQNEIFAEFSVDQVPDSLGITPDGNYAVIANEAENEEDIPEDDAIVGSISVINLADLEPAI
ncbi:MAG: 5'-nucleotidase C-terminal domain-containing protein [Euryarchaeota archaeon]|nr:5'-nucleotidase C-terminal domain-containing protein [Euryarchaeota archaeon]